MRQSTQDCIHFRLGSVKKELRKPLPFSEMFELRTWNIRAVETSAAMVTVGTKEAVTLQSAACGWGRHF